MKRGIMTVVACVALVALAPSPSRSTSLMELDDDDLVQLSSRIFEATVTNTAPMWNPPHDEIRTVVTFSVIQMIKGTAPPSGVIVLPMLGGEVGGVVMELIDQPTFAIGEHVIVFVDDTAPPTMRVTGLSQGKFTILPNPITGEPTVQNRAVSRDAFVREVSRIMAAQGGR